MLNEILESRVKVDGKRVLVIGNTEEPWIEAMLLAKGAKKIVTLDRRGIECQHDLVSYKII